jgi:hypothetical protein
LKSTSPRRALVNYQIDELGGMLREMALKEMDPKVA